MPRRKAIEEQIDSTTAATSEMTTETIEAPTTEASKPVKVKGERLAGEELLQFVHQNKDEPIDDVVFNAGFYTRTTDPETGETKTTLHKPQFFQALTVASTGVEFAAPKRAYSARKGRKPVVTVVKNGNIVVGSRHGSVAGFAPGSKVHVESEHGKIVLTAWQGEGGDEAEDEEDLDL
jgi:hypothetical protein